MHYSKSIHIVYDAIACCQLRKSYRKIHGIAMPTPMVLQSSESLVLAEKIVVETAQGS